MMAEVSYTHHQPTGSGAMCFLLRSCSWVAVWLCKPPQAAAISRMSTLSDTKKTPARGEPSPSNKGSALVEFICALKVRWFRRSIRKRHVEGLLSSYFQLFFASFSLNNGRKQVAHEFAGIQYFDFCRLSLIIVVNYDCAVLLSIRNLLLAQKYAQGITHAIKVTVFISLPLSGI